MQMKGNDIKVRWDPEAGLSVEGADVFPSRNPANISDCLRIMQCHAMTNGDTLVN